MKILYVILSILFNNSSCFDFTIGRLDKGDVLVAQDTMYREKKNFGQRQVASYGRKFNCRITYLRVSDRLGIKPPPRVSVVAGGMGKKYVVLNVQAPRSAPIAVNIYIACANKIKPTSTTKAVATAAGGTNGTESGPVKLDDPIDKNERGDSPAEEKKAAGGGGDKPAEGGGDKPAEGGGDKPAEGGGDKPAEGGGDKPAEGGGDKPAEGGGDKPAEGGGDKPADGGEDKPAEGGGDKPADGGGEKPADGGEEKPADGGEEKPADGGEEKPAEDKPEEENKEPARKRMF